MSDKFTLQCRNTEVVFENGELELENDSGYFDSGWYFWLSKEETRKLYDAMKEHYEAHA